MTGNRSKRDIFIVAGTYLVLAAGAYGIYTEQQKQARVDKVMSGPIHGNKDSRIFHTPTCPQYKVIDPKNLRIFTTIAEAEAAEYRPARNCLDAADLRNKYERADTLGLLDQRQDDYR